MQFWSMMNRHLLHKIFSNQYTIEFFLYSLTELEYYIYAHAQLIASRAAIERLRSSYFRMGCYAAWCTCVCMFESDIFQRAHALSFNK